jgi:hypothetical protein
MITNTGGRDVVLNKIAVRGQESAWGNVYTNTSAIAADITFVTGAPTGNFSAATRAIVLPAGSTMGIIVTAPDSVSLNDIGLTVAFTVFTSQAMYYKETNIQAAP